MKGVGRVASRRVASWRQAPAHDETTRALGMAVVGAVMRATRVVGVVTAVEIVGPLSYVGDRAGESDRAAQSARQRLGERELERVYRPGEARSQGRRHGHNQPAGHMGSRSVLPLAWVRLQSFFQSKRKTRQRDPFHSNGSTARNRRSRNHVEALTLALARSLRRRSEGA